MWRVPTPCPDFHYTMTFKLPDFHYAMTFKLPVIYGFFSSSSSLKRQTQQMGTSELHILNSDLEKNYPLPISKYLFSSNIIPEVSSPNFNLHFLTLFLVS